MVTSSPRGARNSLSPCGPEAGRGTLAISRIGGRGTTRPDRSTGPDGGFYEGDNNALVPNQHLFIVAAMWRFDTGS